MDNNNNDEKVINIGDLFRYLWKNIILFSAVFVGVLVVGLVYSFAIIKPEYKSSATFVVAVREESSGSSSNQNIDYVNSFRIIETVASLVKEDIVLGSVAEEYGVSKSSLSGMVTVTYADMNYLVSVSVKNHDKVKAMNIANSLVAQLISVTENVQGLNFLEGTVTQTSKAEEGVYASPNKMMCILVSFVAGVCVACAVVAIKDVASTKFRNRKEVESRLNAKVLGYFPIDKKYDKNGKKKSGRSVEKAVLLKRDLKHYEPYTFLFVNIKYSDLENPNKAIMVTSSHEDEMKSTIACNLAACIAYNGQKVVIVDLDMRKPVVHKVFNVSGETGLVDLFDGACELKDIVKHTEYGVDVITSGKKIINPMAIIRHKSLSELINKLKREYDYVIIDTAPVLACSDAASIAPLCDGVLFNVAMSDVRKKEAETAISALKTAGAKIIGINVTKGTESKVDGGYYGGYGYYYANGYTTPEVVDEAAAADES
ncbi:MAG: polysaccharide biosynthesis tyrosine autokinase [Candidatus Coproplasma sp.]